MFILTGGIGSGKSTVAKFIRSCGVSVIDVDRIARSVRDMMNHRIVDRFGTSDRLKLRDIVFNDPQARADLEGILLPVITSDLKKCLKYAEDPYIFIEYPLLVPKDLLADAQSIILVESPMGDRLERIMARDSISRELALKMILSQPTDAERRVQATHTIYNLHSLPHLIRNTQSILSEIGILSSWPSKDRSKKDQEKQDSQTSRR